MQSGGPVPAGVLPRPQTAGDRLGQLGQGVPVLLDGHQLQAAVPGDLPGPGIAPAGVLPQTALAVLLRRDQGDAALVHLRRGVHDLKNALGSRQGGEDGGQLLGNLVQGLADLLGVVQVNHQSAQIEAGGHRQKTAEGRRQGVADVHEVVGDGHDGGGIVIGLGSRLPVGLVPPLKFLLGRFLVGEGLDHLEALNHLLNVAVDAAQRGLLGLVVPAALAAHLGEHQHGHDQHHQRHQKEQRVGHQHDGHNAHKHQSAGE